MKKTLKKMTKLFESLRYVAAPGAKPQRDDQCRCQRQETEESAADSVDKRR